MNDSNTMTRKKIAVDTIFRDDILSTNMTFHMSVDLFRI